MFSLTPALILGSNSPRRKAILSQLGLPFQSMASSFSEVVPDHLVQYPDRVPEYFALQKAYEISKKEPDSLVLGFDTAILFNSQILGKPESPQHAYQMLKMLNGRMHHVLTGFALVLNNKTMSHGTETTRVFFNNSPRSTLKAYANSNEPLGKAGAYAIQGNGALLIHKIEGCFYNVVGLPISRTLDSLKSYLHLNPHTNS